MPMTLESGEMAKLWKGEADGGYKTKLIVLSAGQCIYKSDSLQ